MTHSKLFTPRAFRLVGLVAFAAALGACGSKSANQMENSVANTAGNSDAARGIKQTQLASSDWTTRCGSPEAESSAFGFVSETQAYDMGASLQKTSTLFSDRTCATGEVAIVENGKFSLQDRVSNDVYQVNLHFDSASITPLTADAAGKLNALHACGFADWAVGDRKDVTPNTSALPVVPPCLPKTPRDLFDIVQITGMEVRFGLPTSTQDKSGMDKRPSAIDQSVTFYKQLN